MSTPRILEGTRVLVAAEYIKHGGTRTYFKSLLDFYYRHGAEVVAVTSFSQPDQEMQDFVSRLGFGLVTFREFSATYGLGLDVARPAVWSRRSYRAEVLAFERMADACGADRVTVSVGTSGLFLSAARARRKPLIVAHGYPHGWRQRLVGRRWMSHRLPSDARIVTVSDYSGERFRRAWALERSSVDIMTVRSTCGVLAPPDPLESRRPLVMTAALVEDYKRPRDWVEIARLVTNAGADDDSDFIWFGEGPLRGEAQVLADATVPGRASFPGWSDDLEGSYGSARVYLQTSSIESLGLSVVDALRHGIPAVVTRAGGLPEVVLDGVNGFVVSVGDTQAAAKAVVELLRNDDLWNQQALAARTVYQERFSPEMWDQSLLAAHG